MEYLGGYIKVHRDDLGFRFGVRYGLFQAFGLRSGPSAFGHTLGSAPTQ